MLDKASRVVGFVRGFQPNGANPDEHYAEYIPAVDSPFYVDESNKDDDDDVEDNVKYIKAVSGQRIEIGVNLSKFDFQGCSHVWIECGFEGGDQDEHGSAGVCVYAEKPANNMRLNVNLVTIAQTDVPDKGRWKAIDFRFDKVNVNRGLALTKGKQKKEIKKRGKIQIFMQRGSATRQTPPNIWRPREWDKCKFFPSETTPAVANEHGKTHYFRPVHLYHADAPRRDLAMDFTAAEGDSGDPVLFTFYMVSEQVIKEKHLVLASEASVARTARLADDSNTAQHSPMRSTPAATLPATDRSRTYNSREPSMRRDQEEQPPPRRSGRPRKISNRQSAAEKDRLDTGRANVVTDDESDYVQALSRRHRKRRNSATAQPSAEDSTQPPEHVLPDTTRATRSTIVKEETLDEPSFMPSLPDRSNTTDFSDVTTGSGTDWISAKRKRQIEQIELQYQERQLELEEKRLETQLKLNETRKKLRVGELRGDEPE